MLKFFSNFLFLGGKRVLRCLSPTYNMLLCYFKDKGKK